MKHGDCFYTDKDIRGTPSHPWVVISDPEINPDDVLIVNLTDADKHHDQSCILDVSDYPEVLTKRSCVAYQWANVTSVAALEDVVSKNLVSHRPPVCAATLTKILAGAEETDELKNAHRELLRRQSLIS
jgi:hypothetical protein